MVHLAKCADVLLDFQFTTKITIKKTTIEKTLSHYAALVTPEQTGIEVIGPATLVGWGLLVRFIVEVYHYRLKQAEY